MKICYIISDIHKAVYFEQTALHLKAINLDVCYILINCTNGELHRFLISNGFRVHTLEAGSLLKSRKVILACKKLLKEASVDLVHCHLAHANWIGLWGAKLAGIPHRIYTRHSGKPLHLDWKERIIDKVQNRLATKIVAISKNVDELLISQGIQYRKRVLIHHGFELERFSKNDPVEVERLKRLYNPENQKPVIGVIARWLELKGIQYTIDAFSKLLKQHPDALLCLFGASEHGDYVSEIKNKLCQLPEKNYRVIPFENNVFDLYRLFDCYVHVPVNENCEAFGQTYVEALAAQIPSIFTLSGVAREFISHEENALVVPFRDSNAIYDAMIRILNDQQLCTKLKTNGVRDVNHLFGFSTYISNLQKLYTS
ncbi:glycosyltransferase family 4 protein [uncultured Fluviicola sp.]|uniref:glycosyltransferase family 4 protein n=1 Tax=uncultured Fluviicola sp. TaxID=463303 RepID=UPI0025DC1049|nr:glycosyltransferase family 4 protein [uncultured Fluviicola sp.]